MAAAVVRMVAMEHRGWAQVTALISDAFTLTTSAASGLPGGLEPPWIRSSSGLLGKTGFSYRAWLCGMSVSGHRTLFFPRIRRAANCWLASC